MTTPARETRPLLLGEAPSRSGDAYYRFPLSGRPARVVCELAGIPPEADGSTYGRWTWALYDRFECENLFERYASATPWSVPAARARAAAIEEELWCRVVVCLGRRVQVAVCSALGVEVRSFHDRLTVSGRVHASGESLLELVAIPHPSGLNRALNDPGERARCGETLREALVAAAAVPA